MKRPIFHEQTGRDLQRVAKRLPHALGLYGKQGVGLLTAATHLAREAEAQEAVIYPEKNEKVDLEKGTITIDIVRRLYTLTQGKSTQQRCIIVVAADTMSQEAQNAFLKLLEEPTSHTTFILLAYQPSKLLATIRSRLQMQQVRSITREQSSLLLDSIGVTDATRRQQLLFLAAGLPARLTELARDDKAFEQEAGLLRQARVLIQGSLYEKLVVCQSAKGSKQDAIKLVSYAIDLLAHDIFIKKEAAMDVVWLLERLEGAMTQLERNGNVRLVLARVVLS